MAKSIDTKIHLLNPAPPVPTVKSFDLLGDVAVFVVTVPVIRIRPFDSGPPFPLCATLNPTKTPPPEPPDGVSDRVIELVDEQKHMDLTPILESDHSADAPPCCEIRRLIECCVGNLNPFSIGCHDAASSFSVAVPLVDTSPYDPGPLDSPPPVKIHLNLNFRNFQFSMNSEDDNTVTPASFTLVTGNVVFSSLVNIGPYGRGTLLVFYLEPNDWGVNVQPYSCSSANIVVFTGLLHPENQIMGLNSPSYGHLRHGSYTLGGKKVSVASIFFETLAYKVNHLKTTPGGLASYTAAVDGINGCMYIGHEAFALDVFKDLQWMDIRPGNYIFTSMLGLLNYGRQVYSAGIIACVIFSVQEFLKRYNIPFVCTRATLAPFSGTSVAASSVNLEAKTDVARNRTMSHNYVNSLLMLSCFPQSCGHYLFPAYGSEIVWKILACKWEDAYPIIMILGRAVTGKIMPVSTVFADKYVLFMALDLDSFTEVYEGGKTAKNEFSRQIGHLFISTLVAGVGLCTTFYFLLLFVTTVTIIAKRAVFMSEESVLWGCRMGLASTKRLEQQIENTGNFMAVITLNVDIYHGEIGAAAASQIENPPKLVISQMFHVPQLKICAAPVFVTGYSLPMPSLPDLKWVDSMAIFHRKTIDRGRIHVPPVLLKWKALPPKHGT